MKCPIVCLVVLSFCAPLTYADINLGSAGTFAVLAGTAVTNIGLTSVQGNVGVASSTSVTGFPPGILTRGTIHPGDAAAIQAQTDLAKAYNFAAAEPCGKSLTSLDLGGMMLTPGVYCLASTAQLTGTLTLNALNNPDAQFVFQVGTALTTAARSAVVFSNGDQGDNVFWQLGSAATLGANTAFQGNLMAGTSITLGNGASVETGRVLALSGAVTLSGNTIDDTRFNETPEPSYSAIVLITLGLLAASRFFLRGRSAVARTSAAVTGL